MMRPLNGLKRCFTPERLRVMGAAALMALGLGAPATAAAAGKIPAWSGSGWHWELPQQSDLAGARVSWQVFMAKQTPVDVARHLAQAGQRRFVRLQWFGPTLQLSGGQGTGHWLAQLRAVPQGTLGLVSHVQARAAQDAFDLRALVPPDAQGVLRARTRDQGHVQTLSSFRWRGEMSAALRHLDGALRDAGWRPAGHDGAMRHWLHSRAGRLSVAAIPHEQAVSVTFWHDSGGAP